MQEPKQTIPVMPQGKPRGPGRWLKLALVLSLGVNLAVVGVVMGAVLGHGAFLPGARAPSDIGFRPISRAMSATDRVALRSDLRAAAGEWRALNAARSDEAATMLRILRSEPFAPTELRALLDAQQARTQARIVHVNEVLVARIAAMEPAARAAFAERLEEELRRSADRNSGRSQRSRTEQP